METEQDELVPLTDDFISSVCQDIHNRFPKVKRKRLSREEIRRRCHLKRNFMIATWIPCANTRMLSASTSTTWGSLRISSTKYTSNFRIRSTGNNSKFLRPTTNSLSKHWRNDSNWGLLRDQTHSITHPFSAFQRNKAKDFALYRISGSSTRTPT
jgi:hypothetical protein